MLIAQNVLYCGLIAATAYLVSYYTTWWSPYIVALLLTLTIRPNNSVKLLAFIGGFLGFIIPTLFFDIQNESILSSKIAAIFKLPHVFYLHLISSIIGGCLSLLGASMATSIKKVKQK